MLHLEIANEQTLLPVNEGLFRAGVEAVAAEADWDECELSLAIVDDARIHEVNYRFLRHDYPTDVISFVLERTEDGIEGEIVASAETAVRMAAQAGWPAEHELLLYIVHGTLHLAGYDDLTTAGAAAMRQAERRVFGQLQIALPCGYGVTPADSTEKDEHA